MKGRRFVLTADRSLMTNYRGNYLFGFLACGPYRFETSLPYDLLFCPTVEADPRTGEAKVAQCVDRPNNRPEKRHRGRGAFSWCQR